MKTENVKVIDAENAILGRLASYVAKQALKGEHIVIINSEKAIITGNKKDIRENYRQQRARIGSSMKGPKMPKTADRIIKRTIRGMLPEHRWGRGKDAMGRIRCYIGVPKEYENANKIVGGKEKSNKFVSIREITKI